jgi:hypothetical protein
VDLPRCRVIAEERDFPRDFAGVTHGIIGRENLASGTEAINGGAGGIRTLGSITATLL